MPNALTKVFAILLMVYAMVFIPVYQSYQRQDDLAYQVAYQAVTDFVDNVRTKGYMTPQMVEDFETRLEIGSYLYKTEFIHEKKVYTPVYSDSGSWSGEYAIDYDEYYKAQIMPHLFDEPSGTPKAERKYVLSAGDFFTVRVENMTRTKSSMLREFLIAGNSGDGVEIIIPYGGMVLNEDY